MDESYNSQISLRLEKLSCSRDDRILFEELSFTLHTRQVLLLEGRNGSGKTSLLRILCGFREPDIGQVYWCDELINQGLYYSQMVYVGHMDGVKNELTVYENLKMALALSYPGQYKITEALEKVHLMGYEDVFVQRLSAGQKRRLSLVRLLITQNRLWILDEPFTSLDKAGIKIIEELMVKHIAKGGMIILTSHHDVVLNGVDIQRICLS